MIDATIKSGVRPKVTGRIYFPDNTYMDLSGSDFVTNSIVFNSATSNRGEFTIGGAIIGTLSFSLYNTEGKFSGLDWTNTRVYIYMDIGGTRLTSDIYWVAEHKETGQVIKVDCYDYFKILDEHQVYELLDAITWPADAVDVLDKVIDISFDNVTIEGLDGRRGITIQKPTDDLMTFRTLMSYVCQCLCTWAQARPSSVVFSWYDTDNAFDAGNTFTHDLRTEDVTITGVRVASDDGETVVDKGTDANVIEISDNPFIDATNATAVAERIYAGVNGMSFRPGDFSILGNPAIEAGDVLLISNRESKGVKVLATNVTYRVGDGTESVTCDYFDIESDLRISRQKYIKRAIGSELKNPNSELSKAIGGGGTAWPPAQVYVPTGLARSNTTTYATNLKLAAVSYDGTAGQALAKSVTISIDGPIPIPYQLIGVGFGGFQPTQATITGYATMSLPIPVTLKMSVTPPDNRLISVGVRTTLTFAGYVDTFHWITDTEGIARGLRIRYSIDESTQPAGVLFPYSGRSDSMYRDNGFIAWFNPLKSKLLDRVVDVYIEEGSNLVSLIKFTTS